jgi:hypothetical protein
LRVAGLLCALTAWGALGAGELAAGQTVGMDCSLVGVDEVGSLLGFPVSPADAASQRAGACFFPSRTLSREGLVSYAVVRPQTLAERKSFFGVQARQCAGVSPQAPRAAVCEHYVALANVTTLDDYFRARVDVAETHLVEGLGERAVGTAQGLFVKRDAMVLEIVVRRGETLDLDAETRLARLLLARLEATPRP